MGNDLSHALMRTMRTGARLRALLAARATCDFPALLVLGDVADHGPSRAGIVADRLDMDTSVVSRAVASLLDAGLAERVPDPTDGRASLLTVTATGQRLLAEHGDRREAILRDAVAAWTPEDQATFAALLDRFADGVTAAVARHDLSQATTSTGSGVTAEGTPAGGTATPGNATLRSVRAPRRARPHRESA